MLEEEQRQELRERIHQAALAQRGFDVLAAARRLLEGSRKPVQDASFCASALGRMSDALVADCGLRPLKVFIIRSVTIEPMLPALNVEAALQGFLLNVKVGEFGSYVDDPVNAAGPLARFVPDLVFFMLEPEDVAGDLADLIAARSGPAVLERIDSAAELVGTMLRGLRRFCNARVLIHGFLLPDRTAAGDVADANLAWSLPRALNELNARVARLCREFPDCVFFDVDRLAARVGRAAWRDRRLFLASRLPVAPPAQPAFVRGLMRSAAVLFRASRKVLCTDLDNTLWGGIVGEDGPGGILTGSSFPGNCYLEYQHYLKQLSRRGILLALVSKNNPADVEEAFAQRRADLALTLDDFVARKIGWSDKVDSLRALARELSLGLDSFVFVDDHPAECAAVRQQLPEVAIVQASPDEPWRTVEMLAAEPFFDVVTVTEADAQRTEEYRAQARRAKLEKRSGSREDFLRSLDIVCTFLSVGEAPLARAVQLLRKTNQFNLTTRRYGAADVERFAALGLALAVRVRDRFGDAGVVGLVLVEIQNKGQTWRIDSFLMSCRVIGRGIEHAMLAEIMARARDAGAHQVIGEYVPTTKNALCARFYPDRGFVELQHHPAKPSQEAIWYAIDPHSFASPTPAWIELEYSAREAQNRDTVCAHVDS